MGLRYNPCERDTHRHTQTTTRLSINRGATSQYAEKGVMGVIEDTEPPVVHVM